MKALNSVGWGFGLTRIPKLACIHPWTRPDKTNVRWLPINEDIEQPESAALPHEILYRFIEEASHRVIYNNCVCREANRCQDYPIGIGCLQMGDSALDSDPALRREVGVDEAKQYVEKAISNGLVPVVGKVRIDNFIFGIKDRARLLTVCFCCECCCITRFNRYAPARYLDSIFPRLDSIAIKVTDDCKGCGKCAEHCYIGAIEVVGGKARIGEMCRACGRCASFCPSGAVKISIEDPEFLDRAYETIRSFVKYD